MPTTKVRIQSSAVIYELNDNCLMNAIAARIHFLQVYPVLDCVTAQKDVIASLCLQQRGGYYGEA